MQDPNDALQLGMQLWNWTLPHVPVPQKPSRTAIVDTICATLQVDQQEADAFFDRMIARKAYLFPDDIQPEGSMTMFMRNRLFLDALRQLDARIAADDDYDEWEADFFAMQDLCCQRYHRWLQAKGVPETYHEQFPFCVETYLNFIYQYGAGKLWDVSPYAMEEFFMDYLLRKVMVKPPEYTQWPPALRLFYRFLAEKGYLDDPEPTMSSLHAIEPDFIALVQQRS